MKRVISVVATTNPNVIGEVLTEEQLELFAAQRSGQISPQLLEHDHRYPPVGRCIRSWVERDSNGICRLLAEVEQFERGDSVEDFEYLGNRAIPVTASDLAPHIVIDQGFNTEEGLVLARELSRLIASEQPTKYYTKKAAEPISSLVICFGACLLYKVLDGALSALGADAYKSISKAITEHAKNSTHKNQYYEIAVYVIDANSRAIKIRIFADKPDVVSNSMDIENILQKMDLCIKKYLIDDQPLSTIAFKLVDGELVFAYSIRDDCVPTEFDRIPELPAKLMASIGYTSEIIDDPNQDYPEGKQ